MANETNGNGVSAAGRKTYLTAVRENLDSPDETRNDERSLLALGKKYPALAGFPTLGAFLVLLRDPEGDRDRKDEVLGALIRAYQEDQSSGALALLVRAMFPLLDRIAKRRCAHLDPQQHEDAASSVMLGFALAARSFKVDDRPRKIAVNLGWAAFRRARKDEQGIRRERETRTALAKEFAWILEEAERCSPHESSGLFDMLCVGKEEPAPYSVDEVAEAYELLDSLIPEGFLSIQDRELLIRVDAMGRPIAHVAPELGMNAAQARQRHARLLRRLKILVHRRERAGGSK